MDGESNGNQTLVLTTTFQLHCRSIGRLRLRDGLQWCQFPSVQAQMWSLAGSKCLFGQHFFPKRDWSNRQTWLAK